MKRMTYDSKADAAYAHGLEERVARTVEVTSDINVDLSTNGRVVGIEILNARARLSKALGVRLNASELSGIEYEIEENDGVYLHVRHDHRHASLVMPGRLVPA